MLVEAEATNAWNAEASVTLPWYCLPLTITVGVPLTFATAEFGSLSFSARLVESATQPLNFWLVMHEGIFEFVAPAFLTTLIICASVLPLVCSAG